MKKTMIFITILCLVGTLSSLLCLYFLEEDVFFTLAVSFGTTLYHFAIRLLVGESIAAVKKQRWDYKKVWFREKRFEQRFYAFIKIKKWKHKIPTYFPAEFDIHKRSVEELVSATCGAEIVHEVNIPLSFVPILLFHKVEPISLFWITSVCAALLDLIFVMLQRYNRPRLMRLIKKQSSF